MQICAIICEYNPLHLGHVWQIQQAKQRFDGVICIMSGSFVQRGEPAILDKFTRAKNALQAGADAVFELPSLFVLQSAEGFAGGGVRLASALGATHLCFGSETTQMGQMSDIANLLYHQPDILRRTLNHYLSYGLSYASAMQQTLEHLLPSVSSQIFAPNAMLGLEYMKAILKYQSPLAPVALPRKLPISASRCRVALLDGKPCEIPPYVSKQAQARALVSMQSMEDMLLYQLRRMEETTLSFLPHISEGLENRLFAAVQQSTNLEELLRYMQTRRYPLARIKRLLCCALLDITQEQMDRANRLGPQYARLLAINPNNQQVCQSIANATLPICSKGTKARSFSQFQLDRRATDIRSLAANEPCGLDFTAKIAVSRPR